MGSGYVFSNSIDEGQIPECVRTKLRAKIILAIEKLKVCTISELNEYGFKKSTLQKFLKEFISAGLVYQRHQLFKLTNAGEDLSSFLINDERLSKWVKDNFHVLSDDGLVRPSIEKIDYLLE